MRRILVMAMIDQGRIILEQSFHSIAVNFDSQRAARLSRLLLYETLVGNWIQQR